MIRKTCALLAALLCVFLALPVAAQTIVGGSGSATFVVDHGDLVSVGTTLGEVEFQYAGNDGLLRGGLLSYAGLNSEGGGEVVGLGYRRYVKRPGQSYLFFGGGGFVLGEDTPGVGELTAFVGGEVGLQFPVLRGTGLATGFVGIYPAVVGDEGIGVIRAGVRVASDG